MLKQIDLVFLIFLNVILLPPSSLSFGDTELQWEGVGQHKDYLCLEGELGAQFISTRAHTVWPTDPQAQEKSKVSLESDLSPAIHSWFLRTE